MLVVSDTGHGMTPEVKVAPVRAVLHHQADDAEHRPRPGDGIRHRGSERRLHLGGQRAGAGGELQDLLPARRCGRSGARLRRARRRPPAAPRRCCWSRTRTRVRCLPPAYSTQQGYTVLEAATAARRSALAVSPTTDPARADRRRHARHGWPGARSRTQSGPTRHRGRLHVRVRRGGQAPARHPRFPDPFLQKPFSGESLILRVREVLDRAACATES